MKRGMWVRQARTHFAHLFVHCCELCLGGTLKFVEELGNLQDVKLDGLDEIAVVPVTLDGRAVNNMR